MAPGRRAGHSAGNKRAGNKRADSKYAGVTFVSNSVEGPLQMKRRDFMTTATVLVCSVASSSVRAEGAAAHVDYTPDTLAAAKASGKPFMLDFFAPW